MKAPSNLWRGFVLLLTLATLLAAFSLTSCVAYRGGAEPVFVALGTDAEDVTVEPQRLQMKGMNNSRALDRAAQAVERTWRNWLLYKGLVFLSGRYFDHAGQQVDSATTVKLEELRNAASEAQAAAKLKELQILSAGGAL